jgi:integrase
VGEGLRTRANKRRLNHLLVHRAKASVWDTKHPGLLLRVQPTGHKSFCVVYRMHGKPRWYTLGDAAVLPLTDARRMTMETLLAVSHGKDPANEKRRGTAFSTLAARYVEESAKRRNKSWRQGEYLVTRFVLPVLGDLNAEAITRADVRGVVGKLNSPTLANQVLTAMSAIFSWAVKQELLLNNPCRGVERNQTQSRDRVLSDSEVAQFWQAFGQIGLAGTALQVLLLTGQRPGEIARMRWEHIKDGWWTMPGAADEHWPGTKNRQTHRIWLPAAVQEILTALGEEESGFVFVSPPNLARYMRGICQQLTVPRATPHDLRRTHGSRITAKGFGRDAMNRIQNHREGGIADVYDRHQYAEENQRIMETVSTDLISLALAKTVRSNVVRL